MSVRSVAGRCTCLLALVGLMLAMPCAATAEVPQSTEVTLVAAAGGNGQSISDDNIAWSAPTVIPFAAKADGTLIAPSAESLKISNLSVFPIHVVRVQVAEEAPFTLVNDVAATDAPNAFQFSMKGYSAASDVDLASDPAWNMGYVGSGTDTLALEVSSGKLARVTANLDQAQRAATITWTVQAGSAA